MASACAPKQPRPQAQDVRDNDANSTPSPAPHVIAPCTPSVRRLTLDLACLVYCFALIDLLVHVLQDARIASAPINATLPTCGGAPFTLDMSDSVGMCLVCLLFEGLTLSHNKMLINTNVDRVFSHALNTVNKIRTGSQKPPSAIRLRLYGLYKQAMGTSLDVG